MMAYTDWTKVLHEGQALARHAAVLDAKGRSSQYHEEAAQDAITHAAAAMGYRLVPLAADEGDKG
jgi:hypothetical protein